MRVERECSLTRPNNHSKLVTVNFLICNPGRFARQKVADTNALAGAKPGGFAYFQPMSLTILSIQSSVAYGHVGNSAAVFPLQRIGVEVWPVNTVHFSNHTGYGSWRGMILPVDGVAEVILGIEERGVLHECDGVLSGYMGDASLGEVVLDAFQRVKRANPNAVYCCDPVMGDVGRGFFVRPGIPELMRDSAVPTATIITPNQFELEYLVNRTVTNLESALAAVDLVMAMGPRVILVTRLRRADARSDRIA